MRIRRASAEDVPAIRRVTARAYDIYEILLGYLPAPASADPLAWLARGTMWVGERDSEVMAVLLTEPREDHWLVWSAVVDPEWQGEGHGRALLEHAEALARDAGVGELRLTTNAMMDRNISLYRHCGYRITGKHPHPLHPEHELAEMTKTLVTVTEPQAH
jgi:GNAT superfamily N-acetyltransferase